MQFWMLLTISDRLLWRNQVIWSCLEGATGLGRWTDRARFKNISEITIEKLNFQIVVVVN
jgi:hypothetical protein